MAYVAVVGPDAGPRALEDLLEQAREVGRLLAAAGAIVVCGGLGGVMEAVSEGVAEGGGTSLGLLPGRERTDANASLSIALATGLARDATGSSSAQAMS